MKGIIALTLLICLGSWAQANSSMSLVEQLCTLRHKSDAIDSNQSSFMGLLGLNIRVKVIPQKLINASELIEYKLTKPNNSNQQNKANHIHLYLLGQSDHYKQNKNESDRIATRLKEINYSNIQKLKGVAKRLRKTKNFDQCLVEMEKIHHFLQEVENKQKLVSRAQRYLLEKDHQVLAKNIKKKVNHKTRISYNIGLAELTKRLNAQSEPVAVISLHANQRGELFDSNWNAIPRETFKHLSSSIKALVIYSCHIKAVINFYRLYELNAKGIKVYLPTITKKDQWYFNESIPGNFLPQFLKKINKIKYFSPKKFSRIETPNNCKIEFDQSLSEHINGELGVFLNRKFIGFVNSDIESINFHCNDLFNSEVIISMRNINRFETNHVLKYNHSVPIKIYRNEELIISDALIHNFKNEAYLGSKGILQFD
ncbi:hypothetical protein N9N67_04160 [Bacteriovoracaceae bacterium]|nr:hypothetical protein [Bacteriovoracaceae bacterium]